MENKFKKGHWLGHSDTEGILNTSVIISEKIDGANSSVYVNDDGLLIVRSRNNELVDDKANNKMFTRMEEYVKSVHDVTPFEQGFIYFGENCVHHTINYGEMPPFIGFAVLDLTLNEYIKDWYTHYDVRNIPRVNFKEIKTPTVEKLEKYMNHVSAWGTTKTLAEGIFIVNYEKQIFAKIVLDSFKEKNAEIFGAPTKKQDDTQKAIEMFCTTARIHKGIYKLRDEYGMDVDMIMMKTLPLEVYNDILQEEIITISKKFGTINFKNMRKRVSGKCAMALKDFILNQARDFNTTE